MRGEDDVLVNLISDDEDVEFLREVGDLLEFRACEYLARGIRRIAEDERLYAARENLAQLGQVERVVRRVECREDRRHARENGIGAVIFVERGEEPDLV